MIDLKAALLLTVHKIAHDEVSQRLPTMMQWMRQMEEDILASGDPLDEFTARIAAFVGVRRPEKVRLRIYDKVPLLLDADGTPMDWGISAYDPDLHEEAGQVERVSFGPEESLLPLAMSTGYGIGVASRVCLANYGHSWRKVVAHELVHVGQSERFESLEDFWRQVSAFKVQYGYEDSPFEVEAYKLGAEAEARWVEINGIEQVRVWASVLTGVIAR
jgi:hypothetical protein